MNRLNVWALGLAMGAVWGAVMFLVGLTTLWFNWGSGVVYMMKTLYIGFNPTFLGSIIGGVWGFFDAGILGLLIAWIYNLAAK
jgi:hypothetical protein